MRYLTILAFLLLAPLARANDEFSIDIHLGSYPHLVAVPGYPVYYDPYLSANFFFYDGVYWVYQGDGWYESHWYNGPWHYIQPEFVPVYVLRVPVRYYRRPPAYFAGWHRDAPPHWGERWGHDWDEHRAGWNRWNPHVVPPRAPLPSYQRGYSGARYPAAEDQQHALRQQNYHYEPREAETRQRWQEQDGRISHDASHDNRDTSHGNPHAG